ncbi:hypothetical protein BJY01DRAFT_242460 [Aspergillus pseudoustus]|uniref:Xylanolytic transcriptional activator regulatory domain-containing protein n=1 Tax=Aspergillus pseudoustus TaxID=1810923 RepID=A0ABR4KYA3_9EURO
MPPEHSADPYRRLPACDLCHFRKVRYNYCLDFLSVYSQFYNRLNAIASGNAETASKPKFLASARANGVPDALGAGPADRHYICREAALNPYMDRLSPRSKASTAAAPLTPLEPRNSMHLVPRHTACLITLSSATAPGHPTPISPACVDTSSSLIRQELASHTQLSADRVSVLESALELVGSFAPAMQNVEDAHDHQQSTVSDTFTPDAVPPELFYMLLHHQGASTGECLLHWPDHIPFPTLKHMCATLSNRAVNSQVALRCSLSVLYKATVFVSRWLRSGAPAGMTESLGRSREEYIVASLRCLEAIDFTQPPSLSLLQAILSGASLVQLLGEPSRSWYLTGVACRMLVALGYHQLSQTYLESDEAYEIRHCVHWCYYMDKPLSMLLVRPSSLPRLRCQPSNLVREDASNPLSLKVKVLSRLAHVQDRYLDILFQTQQSDGNDLPGVVDSFRMELSSISADIVKYRTLHASTPVWESEWDAVDFTFFSIATTVLRLNSLVLHDNTYQEECVGYARNALSSMQACHRHLSGTFTVSTDSLIWTVLLYPLTPFFVLFCNVVASSNVADLHLLKETTLTISNVPDQRTFGSNLQHLLSRLIALCSGLHDLQDRDRQIPSAANGLQSLQSTSEAHSPASHFPQGHAATEGINYNSGSVRKLPENDQGTSNNTPIDEQQLQQQPVTNPTVSGDGSDQGKDGCVWDDELFWELFNIQPSVEWFDVNYYNTMER